MDRDVKRLVMAVGAHADDLEIHTGGYSPIHGELTMELLKNSQ